MVNAGLLSETVENKINTSLKWCSVSLADVIAREKRLEASVYDIEAKRARQLIESGKFPLITIGGRNGLASSYTCARFKRVWVEKSDIPIYQPSAIVDIKPEPDGYISHVTQTDIEALRVKKGQVLMTCSGTIGKVAFVSDTLDQKVFSHDLLRIDCKNTIDKGYLYAYLKSKTGSKILLSNRYGAVITHIEPEHLATVPIPDASKEIKERIHNLIMQSYKLRDESNDLMEKATALLVKELHLPVISDFRLAASRQSREMDTFTVKLSDLSDRIDASYHAPIVNAVLEHMAKYAVEITTVGDRRISREVVLPPRFARVYVEEGYGRVLIGGKQIHELDPSGKKYLSNTKHRELMDKLEVHQNTSLITRSGSVGKVALVPKHWERWIPSDHIIRVVPASDDIAGYLNVFLASDYGRVFIKRYIYGSVVDEIDDNHVRRIPIPVLKDRDIQREINALALLANEKRYRAYLSEQQALKIMEEEVISVTESQIAIPGKIC